MLVNMAVEKVEQAQRWKEERKKRRSPCIILICSDAKEQKTEGMRDSTGCRSFGGARRSRFQVLVDASRFTAETGKPQHSAVIEWSSCLP